MSWPMQTPGSWNPGMAVSSDNDHLMMTPEQWTAMQNWQNYAQWQQQYAQWQSQYGEKYAEQIQGMQAMSGMPPLPPAAAAPPPAPPPPDKPPPPPHENNQPLYGHISSQPAPVPAPNTNQQKSQNPANNINVNTQLQAGNNQNWSYGQESSLASVNAEALKKLAEEERLFDIQFLKWEEEIEKWKKDNVNHPDKQAYKEYEDKFEACRAQLLERRQQMNKKKARLLGTAPPPPHSAAKPSIAANTYSALPPPPPPSNNVNMNKQQQNSVNNVTPSLNKQQNYGNSLQNPQNYGNNSQNYSDSNNYQYQQYNMPPNQNPYNKSNNMAADNQEKFDTYSNSNKYPSKDSSSAAPNNPSFLLASESNKKGIPGLDLVPEPDKSYKSKQDVIDITDDRPSGQLSKAPDYSTISKGINNILGDEKIMNILSMVSRAQVSSDSKNSTQSNQNSKQGHFDGNRQSNSPFDQGFKNQNYGNQQYENSPNNMLYANRQGGNYQQQNQEDSMYMPHQKRQDQMNQDQYGNYNRNNPYGGNDMGSYNNGLGQGGPPPGRPNVAGPIRPLMQDILGPNDLNRGTSGLQNSRNNFHLGPGAEQQNNFSRGPPGPQNEFNRGPSGPGQRNDFRGAGMQNDYNRGPGQQDDNSRPPGLPGPPERRPLLESNMNQIAKAPMPKWIDEPMFNPSLIVEYEHKPLRLKARDFIEPVHMFDYNHISKDEDNKKKDFEKEADELFNRKPRRDREYDYSADRYSRDYSRDFERRAPREDFRDKMRLKGPPRDDYEDRRRYDEDRRKLDEDRRRLEDDRRRLDNKYDDRRRDDRDHYRRRDDMYRERDKDYPRDRDRGRDIRREDIRRDDFRRDDARRDDVRRDDIRRDDRHRSRSRERDMRKRGLSRDSEVSDSYSKRLRDKENIPASQFEQPKHTVMIDDLLEFPGREMRPQKIVIILRGPPGSGKSYLAKLIRDREAELGGTVRIMSIDDYFMQEGEVEEKDPTTGKMVKKPTLKYEYDEASEEAYLNSLKRAFKRCLTDGYFSFIVYDANNETLKSYGDVWNIARQNDFQVYICDMELDPKVCFKRNIHNRTLADIEIISARFYPTPPHHIRLDATTLLQSGAITEVQMEDVDDEVVMEDAQEPEVESVFTSKWEAMDDAAQLARLDGTSKPLRPSQLSMEDYLQLDDWKPTTAKPGKKTVRWADIEERREQEKMRAIGFVVGQTDWNRMTDPTMGSSALTQTKYIARVRRN